MTISSKVIWAWRRVVMAGLLGLLVSAGHISPAEAKHFNAGGISNDGQAAAFCPKLCAKHGRVWNGSWRPADGGDQATCGCSKNDMFSGSPALPVRGPGTSCTAQTNSYCPGCSVSCPAGQQASCTEGTPLNDDQEGCWTASSCVCD